MKTLAHTGILVIFLTCMMFWPTGCGRVPDQLDGNWTAPVSITGGVAGLGGSARLHKYRDTIIGEQVQKSGSRKVLLWKHADNSWFEAQLTDLHKASWAGWGASGIDPESGKILFAECYAENEQLVLNTFTATIDQSLKLREIAETVWTTGKKTVLGETAPNVTMSNLDTKATKPMRVGAVLGTAILRGPDLQIPYYFRAYTYTPPNTWASGPFSSGVLHSSDSGRTWRLEKVSDQVAPATALRETKGYTYYFAGPYPLLFSRKPADGESWETPKPITKTSHGVDGFYGVAGSEDTAHICWMDRRHDKTRFNLTGPPVVNSDIYYRRRNDSDSDWSKDVWLSKGLSYCYAPTIAAEGDKVVVAWAGIRDAGKWHGEYGPNDIYYVTSKDGGKTWTRPLKVTDGAKDGITTGMPHVALLSGTIHLLYLQSAKRTPKELSPGLTKLGQEPWPIYHQQRPFPD